MPIDGSLQSQPKPTQTTNVIRESRLTISRGSGNSTADEEVQDWTPEIPFRNVRRFFFSWHIFLMKQINYSWLRQMLRHRLRMCWPLLLMTLLKIPAQIECLLPKRLVELFFFLFCSSKAPQFFICLIFLIN